MIKLLATDCDGTLFQPKRRIRMMTRANKRLLEDFALAGGKVVLVTGRSKRAADKVNTHLKSDVALLGCNGAYVYENGKMVESHPIDRKDLMELYISTRSSYGIIGWLLFDDTDRIKIAPTNMGKIVSLLAVMLNLFNFNYGEKYVPSETAFIDSIANHPVYKVMPVFGLSAKATAKSHEAFLSISDKFKGKITITEAHQCLEITAPGINKARTLKEYIALEGIGINEVAVAGDSFNDATMFENFPFSFWMDTGDKEVKDKAKYTIHSVSEIRPFILTPDGKLLDGKN